MSSQTYRYYKVKQEIISYIQGFPQDTRIPSRIDLMKRFEVTRTTIDRAISELIGEGYLYTRLGSGTFTARKDRQAVFKENHSQVNHSQVTHSQVTHWGMIIPSITHSTYPEILRGVEDVCSKSGVNLIVCNTDYDTDKQDQYIRKLVHSGVDGLIVMPAPVTSKSLSSFELLLKHNIRFVFCGRGIDAFKAPKVVPNDFHGGYIATRHLLQLGWKRPAYLGGRLFTSSEQRFHGYLCALNESNQMLVDEYIKFGETDSLGDFAYESMYHLLRISNPPDSVFCFNDKVAQGVYRSITENGLVVGRDIGVVGYDDTEICELLPVKLTSIHYPKYEIGQMAAELLLEILLNEVPENKMVVLPPKLMIRESCGETS